MWQQMRAKFTSVNVIGSHFAKNVKKKSCFWKIFDLHGSVQKTTVVNKIFEWHLYQHVMHISVFFTALFMRFSPANALKCSSWFTNWRKSWHSLLKTLQWAKVPATIYLLKINNRNTSKRCKVCSKLTIKTPKRHQYTRTASKTSSSVLDTL